MNSLTPLEKALILSYLHLKQSIMNLEVSVHEMKVQNHPSAGRLLHRYNNLLSASKKAFETVEKNIDQPEELLSDIEATLSAMWEKI